MREIEKQFKCYGAAPIFEGDARTRRTPKASRNQTEEFCSDEVWGASGTLLRDSTAPGLAGWFGLLWRLGLSACGCVAVKQDAVRSQIADQHAEIIRYLIVV